MTPNTIWVLVIKWHEAVVSTQSGCFAGLWFTLRGGASLADFTDTDCGEAGELVHNRLHRSLTVLCTTVELNRRVAKFPKLSQNSQLEDSWNKEGICRKFGDPTNRAFWKTKAILWKLLESYNPSYSPVCCLWAHSSGCSPGGRRLCCSGSGPGRQKQMSHIVTQTPIFDLQWWNNKKPVLVPLGHMLFQFFFNWVTFSRDGMAPGAP